MRELHAVVLCCVLFALTVLAQAYVQEHQERRLRSIEARVKAVEAARAEHEQRASSVWHINRRDHDALWTAVSHHQHSRARVYKKPRVVPVFQRGRAFDK